MTKAMTCCEAGCTRPVKCRNLCNAHYQQALKAGRKTDGPGTNHGAPLLFIEEVARRWDRDECLLWPFSTSDSGYALVWLEGRMTRVSRILCSEEHGPAPSDRHEAAHGCGKGHRGCINRHHLRWATPSENQADRIRHGTSNRGARHGLSKLSTNDVRRIRELARTRTRTAIADEFGLSVSTVCGIVNGKSWAWLEGSACR